MPKAFSSCRLNKSLRHLKSFGVQSNSQYLFPSIPRQKNRREKKQIKICLHLHRAYLLLNYYSFEIRFHRKHTNWIEKEVSNLNDAKTFIFLQSPFYQIALQFVWPILSFRYSNSNLNSQDLHAYTIITTKNNAKRVFCFLHLVYFFIFV